jgi:hypothetical protein
MELDKHEPAPVFGEERESRGLGNVVVAVGTVLCGLAVGVTAIHYFRAHPVPAPVVVQAAPSLPVKPQIVERFVEKRVEVPVPVPAAPAPRIESGSWWDGVWRMPKYALPMFHLKVSGATLSGKYAPSWSAVNAFAGGKVLGDGSVVQFAVADQWNRVHFRMWLLHNGDARLEAWISPEDWLEMLARANARARTVQDAFWARLALEDMVKRLGQPVYVGTFRKIPSPG